MKLRWKLAIILVLLLAGGLGWIANDISKTSAFMAAAYAGQTDVLAKILKDGENVNVQDARYNNTALIYASQQGNMDAVKLLLANHADVNIVSRYHQTALGQAAYAGNTDIAKLLLKQGAKLDAQERACVIEDAAAHHPDVAKLLPPAAEAEKCVKPSENTAH